MNNSIDFVSDKRTKRSHRFANQILHLMQDYIPNDCKKRAYEFLINEAEKGNLEIISVPLQCDHLEKLDLERKMLETSIKKIKD